jgi:hypothetical protein
MKLIERMRQVLRFKQYRLRTRRARWGGIGNLYSFTIRTVRAAVPADTEALFLRLKVTAP